MKYTVMIHKDAMKILDKMDPSVRERIMDWIYDNLNGCENPRIQGKPLKGDRKGVWRYRVGDYRILAQIRDDVLLILVVDVGHRSIVYER